MIERVFHTPSPLGTLTFTLDADGALTSLSFRRGAGTPAAGSVGRQPGGVTIDESAEGASPVAAALAAYFRGELTAIDTLPVASAGTPFQQRVWAALRRIPVGTTVSYGELAAEVGSVARAVGTANGANPVGLVVPCHRVIGGHGALVGYAAGLDIKRWLLRHEGALLV